MPRASLLVLAASMLAMLVAGQQPLAPSSAQGIFRYTAQLTGSNSVRMPGSQTSQPASRRPCTRQRLVCCGIHHCASQHSCWLQACRHAALAPIPVQVPPTASTADGTMDMTCTYPADHTLDSCSWWGWSWAVLARV